RGDQLLSTNGPDGIAKIIRGISDVITNAHVSLPGLGRAHDVIEGLLEASSQAAHCLRMRSGRRGSLRDEAFDARGHVRVQLRLGVGASEALVVDLEADDAPDTR